MDGSGEDPVGKHASTPGFPLSVFTTTNNIPNSRGIVELLLPERLHHRIDDVIKAWGVHNLVKSKSRSKPTVRAESMDTINGLISKLEAQPGKQKNMFVQGKLWCQLLRVALGV